MPFKHPPSESQPRPSVVDLRARPHKAVDVLGSFEQKDQEKYFDPNIDIHEDVKKEILERIKYSRVSGKDWCDFLPLAANWVFVFPELRSELKLGDRDFNGVLSMIHADDMLQPNSFYHMGDLLVLFPDRRRELKLDEDYKKLFWTDTYFQLSSTHPSVQAEASVLSRILFLDSSEYTMLDDASFDKMLKELNTNRHETDLSNFAYLAADMAVLFPDKKPQLKLDEEIFFRLKVELENYRRDEDWEKYASYAKLMKILSADRAEIIDGQIKLTNNPPDMMPKRRPLPVRSNI